MCCWSLWKTTTFIIVSCEWVCDWIVLSAHWKFCCSSSRICCHYHWQHSAPLFSMRLFCAAVNLQLLLYTFELTSTMVCQGLSVPRSHGWCRMLSMMLYSNLWGAFLATLDIPSHFDLRKGKIWQAMRGIIHVILLKKLRYLLSHILQTRWPIIPDIAVRRHTHIYTIQL